MTADIEPGTMSLRPSLAAATNFWAGKLVFGQKRLSHSLLRIGKNRKVPAGMVHER